MGDTWSKDGNVAGGKKEVCSPFPEDKPPQLNFEPKKASDVPKFVEPWSDDNVPIDILLLTVDSCDFLNCFSFLDQPFKSYKCKIGFVYFGCMGDANDQDKLKVALLYCPKGLIIPGGPLTTVQKALSELGPKAVFFVGTCTSLNSEKVKMGDVVIPSKLIIPGVFITPISPRLGSLARDAPNGWVAPLKNSDKLKVQVHCSGDMLSQSLTELSRCDDILAKYTEAVAIETEAKDVYAAAYYENVEWMIVNGVASYFHQGQSATDKWMSFASAMAASVVAKMLEHPTVFQEWLHCNKETLRKKRPPQECQPPSPKKKKLSLSHRVGHGKKKELCQPSPEDKMPPKLRFRLKNTDVPNLEKWSSGYLPIDILLLTAESCDFLSCFSFLDQPFKSYKLGIGYVFFGRMGNVSDEEKLKVALINCSPGAAIRGGSLSVVHNAVRALQPKALFSVGSCISLGLEKARIGDVVISSRLITTEGFKTPVSPRLGSIALYASYGWKAPLKHPDEREIKVHCNGEILSLSLLEKCQSVNICETYPEAIAIETEGEGTLLLKMALG